MPSSFAWLCRRGLFVQAKRLRLGCGLHRSLSEEALDPRHAGEAAFEKGLPHILVIVQLSVVGEALQQSLGELRVHRAVQLVLNLFRQAGPGPRHSSRSAGFTGRLGAAAGEDLASPAGFPEPLMVVCLKPA